MDAAGLLELPAGRAARVLALRHLRDAAEARRRFQDPEDAEALHDFRVAVRRLRCTLRHYRPHLDDGVTRGDRRRFRALARATGAARDAEVQVGLLERWRGGLRGGAAEDAVRHLDRLRERKAEAGRELRSEVAADFDRAAKRLERHLREYRCEVDPDDPAGGARCADAVRERLAAAAGELRERLDAVRSARDQAEAHRARIAAKRLRYLLEPFARAVEGLPGLIRRLKELQDLLGDMHDAETLRAGAPEGLAERALAERDRLFGEVDAGWLGGAAAELFQQARAVERRLAGSGGPAPPRRYLLRGFPRIRGVEPEEVEQGWLPGDRLAETVRRVRRRGEERWIRAVRVGEEGGAAEEETPPALGRSLWKLTRGRRIRKRRYRVEEDGVLWTVDRHGRRGPVLAEAEPTGGGDGPLAFPPWLERHVVREVTGDPAYLDEGLAR